MAAMQRQFIINLADLRFVSIECKNCSSILTLDMEKPETQDGNHKAVRPVRVVPPFPDQAADLIRV